VKSKRLAGWQAGRLTSYQAKKADELVSHYADGLSVKGKK
jgi:hypothetical protein